MAEKEDATPTPAPEETQAAKPRKSGQSEQPMITELEKKEFEAAYFTYTRKSATIAAFADVALSVVEFCASIFVVVHFWYLFTDGLAKWYYGCWIAGAFCLIIFSLFEIPLTLWFYWGTNHNMTVVDVLSRSKTWLFFKYCGIVPEVLSLYGIPCLIFRGCVFCYFDYYLKEIKKGHRNDDPDGPDLVIASSMVLVHHHHK